MIAIGGEVVGTRRALPSALSPSRFSIKAAVRKYQPRVSRSENSTLVVGKRKAPQENEQPAGLIDEIDSAALESGLFVRS